MNDARYPFEPDYAVPPGETLKEYIIVKDTSLTALVIETGIPRDVLYDIIRGTYPITPAMALLLEEPTDIPARMWNSLEAQYRTRTGVG